MQPKTYRKVVHDITAIQWKPETRESVLEWLRAENANYSYNDIASGSELIIYTLEGPYQVKDNWWIIKGIMGEFYPCDPAIFDASYKEVNGNQDNGS